MAGSNWAAKAGLFLRRLFGSSRSSFLWEVSDKFCEDFESLERGLFRELVMWQSHSFSMAIALTQQASSPNHLSTVPT